MYLNEKDLEFLEYVKGYVTNRPEISAYVNDFVAKGVSVALAKTQRKASDFELALYLNLTPINKADRMATTLKSLKKWESDSSLGGWESIQDDLETRLRKQLKTHIKNKLRTLPHYEELPRDSRLTQNLKTLLRSYYELGPIKRGEVVALLKKELVGSYDNVTIKFYGYGNHAFDDGYRVISLKICFDAYSDNRLTIMAFYNQLESEFNAYLSNENKISSSVLLKENELFKLQLLIASGVLPFAQHEAAKAFREKTKEATESAEHHQTNQERTL